jgi:hypothetical protein
VEIHTTYSLNVSRASVTTEALSFLDKINPPALLKAHHSLNCCPFNAPNFSYLTLKSHITVLRKNCSANQEVDNAMFYPNDNPYSPTQSFTKEDILSFAMSDAASLHVFLTYVVCSSRRPISYTPDSNKAYLDPR